MSRNIKIVLKGALIVTWDSMSLSCSPWASTRTAISRKIWCNSSKFFSISFTVSCRSWISRMVSRIWPRPCSWIATWRKFSLSPVSMIFSMMSSSGFSPVIVKYLQLQQMQNSSPQLFTTKLKNQETLHTHDLKFENQETGLGWYQFEVHRLRSCARKVCNTPNLAAAIPAFNCVSVFAHHPLPETLEFTHEVLQLLPQRTGDGHSCAISWSASLSPRVLSACKVSLVKLLQLCPDTPCNLAHLHPRFKIQMCLRYRTFNETFASKSC